MQRSLSVASSAAGSATGVRCRLCWGEETDADADAVSSPLISPCNCRGSVGYIHVHCLQHWLEVKRQQGVSRHRTVRCEVCNAKYNPAHIPTAPGRAPLLPRLWSDPYAIAAVLHGAWRAYVVSSGMFYAYTIYASINKGIGQQQPLVHTHHHARRQLGGSSGPGGGMMRLQQPPGFLGAPVQPLRHHLSLSLPVGSSGSSSGAAGGGLGRAVVPLGSARVDGSLLATIRQRFDKATMVQVYWYTGLMGLMPTPPNADAFAGMAVGATVGGMVAQLVFLPMLGSGKLAALSCSCQLLLRCLLRLLAAEACQARGYRVLAGAIRGLMQRWQRMRRRRQQQQQLRLRQLQEGAAGVVAAADDVQ